MSDAQPGPSGVSSVPGQVDSSSCFTGLSEGALESSSETAPGVNKTVTRFGAHSRGLNEVLCTLWAQQHQPLGGTRGRGSPGVCFGQSPQCGASMERIPSKRASYAGIPIILIPWKCCKNENRSGVKLHPSRWNTPVLWICQTSFLGKRIAGLGLAIIP